MNNKHISNGVLYNFIQRWDKFVSSHFITVYALVLELLLLLLLNKLWNIINNNNSYYNIVIF